MMRELVSAIGLAAAAHLRWFITTHALPPAFAKAYVGVAVLGAVAIVSNLVEGYVLAAFMKLLTSGLCAETAYELWKANRS